LAQNRHFQAEVLKRESPSVSKSDRLENFNTVGTLNAVAGCKMLTS